MGKSAKTTSAKTTSKPVSKAAPKDAAKVVSKPISTVTSKATPRTETKPRPESNFIHALTPEQRLNALKLATETRAKRRKIREDITAGKTSVAKVFADFDAAKSKSDTPTEKVIGRIPVWALLTSTPKIGPVTAEKYMLQAYVAPLRIKKVRVRGLGIRQRKALLDLLSA